MHRKKWIFALCGMSVALGLFHPSGGGTCARAQEVVIIANSSVGDSELSQQAVKDMFLGDRSRWGDNDKVALATLKEGVVHDQFLGSFIKKTSSQFSTYWKKQVFTGKGKMPSSFGSEGDLVEFVGKTDGAIGYVGAGAPNSGIKVITVMP